LAFDDAGLICRTSNEGKRMAGKEQRVRLHTSQKEVPNE